MYDGVCLCLIDTQTFAGWLPSAAAMCIIHQMKVSQTSKSSTHYPMAHSYGVWRGKNQVQKLPAMLTVQYDILIVNNVYNVAASVPDSFRLFKFVDHDHVFKSLATDHTSRISSQPVMLDNIQSCRTAARLPRCTREINIIHTCFLHVFQIYVHDLKIIDVHPKQKGWYSDWEIVSSTSYFHVCSWHILRYNNPNKQNA